MQATHSIHSTHPKCPVFEPKNSPSRTAFYQSVQKAGGLDALELFNSVVASKAFEVSGWMGWNGMGLCGCLCGGGGGAASTQAPHAVRAPLLLSLPPSTHSATQCHGAHALFAPTRPLLTPSPPPTPCTPSPSI